MVQCGLGGFGGSSVAWGFPHAYTGAGRWELHPCHCCFSLALAWAQLPAGSRGCSGTRCLQTVCDTFAFPCSPSASALLPPPFPTLPPSCGTRTTGSCLASLQLPTSSKLCPCHSRVGRQGGGSGSSVNSVYRRLVLVQLPADCMLQSPSLMTWRQNHLACVRPELGESEVAAM